MMGFMIHWEYVKTEIQGSGYTYAIVPNHPNSDKRGRVLEHRIVAENHLNRLLLKTEVVHHLNGNKKDNRIENLEVMTAGQHTKRHHPKREVITHCPECEKKVVTVQSQLKNGSKFCSRQCSGKYWQRLRRVPKLKQHGTYSRYRKGCRCKECRASNAARKRKDREKQRVVG